MKFMALLIPEEATSRDLPEKRDRVREKRGRIEIYRTRGEKFILLLDLTYDEEAKPGALLTSLAFSDA